MDKQKKAPHFIGIGMERAGTSWLFTMLAAHRDIWLPPLKELHYFDAVDPTIAHRHRRYTTHLLSRIKQKSALFHHYKTRPELYKNSALEYMLWDLKFFTGRMTDQWYQSLFSPRFHKGRICGEITPAYCRLSAPIIDRILTMNPDMKFILMTRHGGDRAWSSMIHQLCHIQKRPFHTLSTADMMNCLQSDYTRRHSDLPAILDMWQSKIPAEQLFIRPMTDIKRTPGQLLHDLYDFLDVSADFTPPDDLTKKQINTHTRQDYHQPDEIRAYLAKTYPKDD